MLIGLPPHISPKNVEEAIRLLRAADARLNLPITINTLPHRLVKGLGQLES